MTIITLLHINRHIKSFYLGTNGSTQYKLKNFVSYCRFENMPISSSLYENNYVEDFTLKHLFLSEICGLEMCRKFVYKHSEAIKYIKN